MENSCYLPQCWDLVAAAFFLVISVFGMTVFDVVFELRMGLFLLFTIAVALAAFLTIVFFLLVEKTILVGAIALVCAGVGSAYIVGIWAGNKL